MYSYEISEGRRHKLKIEDAHRNSKLKVYKNSKLGGHPYKICR